jgi:diguanylate cyclase (GGDEF)-like protein
VNEENGHRSDVAGAEGFAEPEPVDVERAAAETDQDLSDTDQTLSDSDQAIAERDQAESDADQAASDRDQAASDREFGRFRASDLMKTDHAASESDRSRNSAARRAATGARAGSMLARSETGRKRDEVASLRDMQAQVRDRTAELRDDASDDHERALGRPGGYPSRGRATAAEDRQRAAEDRKRAAADRARAAEDREHALGEVRKAEMDDLTGFFRSRLGNDILRHEIDRAERNGGQLVFLYVDVNGLKQINDTLGHEEGNRLLRAVAEAMRSRLRSYDPVVRVGGDEFVSALPGIDVDQAVRVAVDIQGALGKAYAGATMSYGLSTLEPGDTVATMVKRGDDALRAYKAADGS